MIAAAFVAAAAGAVELVGPGDFTYETQSDVSFVGESFAVPTGAAVTNHAAIFYPDGGPLGVYETVFTNVKLSDIDSFTGQIGTADYDGNKGWEWLDATAFHDAYNDDGTRSVQLQALRNSNYIQCFALTFKQDGSDVACRIDRCAYAYRNDTDQQFGVNMAKGGYGQDRTVLSEEGVAGGNALRNLGCKLKTDVTPVIAPTAVVVANSDDSEVAAETRTYAPCLTTDKVVVFENIDVGDVESVTGELGSTSRIGPDWMLSQGYNKYVYDDGSVEFQIQTHNVQGAGQTGLYCVFVLLEQCGKDVTARAHYAEKTSNSPACWSYGDKLGFNFYHSNIGTSVTLVDTKETDGLQIALRNLTVTAKPKKRAVRGSSICLVKEWTKLWENVRLADVEPGYALMGGSGVGGVWRTVRPYARAEESEGVVKYYYQLALKDYVRSVRVAYKQKGGDVWAMVSAVSYAYDVSAHPIPWENGDGEYSSAITDTVDGSVDGKNNTLAITGLSAVRKARMRHTVTVDPTRFGLADAPLVLGETCLAFAVADGETATLPTPVAGYGAAVGSAGDGTAALAEDLPQGVGLEAASGVVEIRGARTIGGAVNVASGAALAFRFTADGAASLAADGASFADGAEVVLTADAAVQVDDGAAVTLVSGAGFAAGALDGVTCRTDGKMARYKAALSVADNGDVVATLTRRQGFVVAIR